MKKLFLILTILISGPIHAKNLSEDLRKAEEFELVSAAVLMSQVKLPTLWLIKSELCTPQLPG